MPVTAAQLSGFLDWLRDGGSGFEAGDQQYLAAQQLTETLAARGEWPAERVAWRTLLAPVLSSSPAQQQRFYELLDQWFATPVSPAPTPGPDSSSLGKKGRRPIPREAWLYGSLCLVLASALLAGAIHYWPHPRPPHPDSTHFDSAPPSPQRVDQPKGPVHLTVHAPNGQPLPDATAHYAGGGSPTTDSAGFVALNLPNATQPRYLVVTKPGYRSVVQNFPTTDTPITLQPAAPPKLPHHLDRWYIRHAQVLRMVVMLIPGILLLLWLIRLFGKALELRKWATTSEPRMRRIATSNKTEPLYPAAGIRRLAVALRRRRPEESPELDLQSTVETTCRQAGYFTPVFATRNSEPEYLFLGERKNLRDHQARMQDELIRRLRDHDVYVQRYYFQSTPSTCSDANGDVFSLNELAAMHPDNEVWLALDASRCLDPVSGIPEKWWGSFSHWQYRTLLSFTRAEVDTEVRISDPTRKGIEDLVLDTQPAAAQPAKEQPYPSVLRDSPDSWLSNLDPPPAAIARLNAQLQMFLSADGYLLLQATAVYPEIAWNITATLAAVLIPAAEREAVLNRLAALPWFRHGIMPDWLRVRLLSRLGPNEQRVRSAVRRYLDTSVDTASQKEEALEIAPGPPRRGSSKGALKDHVYLAFASGRKLDQLSVQAPKGWRKFLRDSVWLRVATALVLMAAIWVVTNRVMIHLVEKSQPRLNRPANLPPDPYVTALMQVAEAKEGTMDPDPHGLSNLQQYSSVASDVLNVNDPLQSMTFDDLKGRLVPRGAPLLPGMAIETTHGIELVKAVSGDDVLTFGAPDYIARKDLSGAFDLSGIPLTPRNPTNTRYEAVRDRDQLSRLVEALSDSEKAYNNRVSAFNAACAEIQATNAALFADCTAKANMLRAEKAALDEEKKRLATSGFGLPAPPALAADSIVGKWVGTLYQQPAGTSSSYQGEFTLTSPNSGTSSYPSLNCGGDLSGGESGGIYRFRESIVTRRVTPTSGGCIDGNIEMVASGDTMTFHWRGYWEGQNIVVSGTLRRVDKAVATAAPAATSPPTSLSATVPSSSPATATTAPVTPAQAASLRNSCAAGKATDCTALGSIYANGTGVPKDYAQAVALFRKGCDGGDPLGCVNLGELYQNGMGVAKDDVQATALYRKACDGGAGAGCDDLGEAYRDGTGVAKDVSKATTLYQKGCSLGEKAACDDLKRLLASTPADSPPAAAPIKYFPPPTPASNSAVPAAGPVGKGTSLSPSDQQAYLATMLSGRSRTLMTSGGDAPVADGGPDGHSIFAYAFLQALQNPPAETFSAEAVFDSVKQRVAESAKQIPTYGYFENPYASGDFVFQRMASTFQRIVSSTSTFGNYYALVVGIDQYQHPMPPLKSAVNDARGVADELNKQYGFHVSLLLDKAATRANILDKLNSYRGQLGPNDNLVIYYAGAGIADPSGNKPGWIPADATSEDSTDRILMDEVMALANALPARHVLIISDSCYAGGFPGGQTR